MGTPAPLFKELVTFILTIECSLVHICLFSYDQELDFMQKDEEVEFFREKFAGSQADRKVKAEAEAKLSEQLNKTKISGQS